MAYGRIFRPQRNCNFKADQHDDGKDEQQRICDDILKNMKSKLTLHARYRTNPVTGQLMEIK